MIICVGHKLNCLDITWQESKGRCWGQTSGSWQLWPSLSVTQTVSYFSIISFFPQVNRIKMWYEKAYWYFDNVTNTSILFWLLTVWCGYKQRWWHSDVNDAGDATQKLGWDAMRCPDTVSSPSEMSAAESCIMPSIITFSLIIPRNPISILFTASSSDYHKSPDRDLSDFQTFYHYLLSGWGTKKAVSRFSIKHQQISQLFLSFVERWRLVEPWII